MAQELLPGEHLLWSGQPGRTAIRPAEVARSMLVVAAVALFAVFSLRSLHGVPTAIWAFALLIVACLVYQAVVQLIQLAGLPAQRRQTIYRVTDYRIVVTRGPRARHSWSAYLDQIADPVVRPGRDGTADVVLRSGSGPAILRLLNGLFGSGPFSALGRPDIPLLELLPDAAAVRQLIADGRQRALSTLGAAAPALPLQTPGAAPPSAPMPHPVVAGLTLEPGEQVRWTGRPERVPWWLGSEDIGLSAFGLFWMAAVATLGWASATTGSGTSLIFVVPLALTIGVYPAIGRVLHRRARIRRSHYVVTDRRVAVTWQLGGRPVTVQQPLWRLLPPELRWESVFTWLVQPDPRPRSGAWSNLLWPAATVGIPALVGLADPDAAREAIADGQLAARRSARS